MNAEDILRPSKDQPCEEEERSNRNIAMDHSVPISRGITKLCRKANEGDEDTTDICDCGIREAYRYLGH